jgi:O-antigen ligase
VTQAVVTASPTTAVTPPSHAPEPPPRALARLRSDAPVGLVLLACAWWLLVAPRLEGGRGVGAVTAGAILTGLATLAIRPQQVVPARAVGLALLVSAAALGVAVVAPTGWAGASTAASYVCVSWTVIAVAAAVIRQPSVVNLVLSVAVGGVLIEVAESWLAWWGGASASLPMFGTFYWYNPFAVFLLAGTVIGLSQWLLRSGLFAWFGLLGAVLGTVGIVYSTSRATGACFAVAVGLVAVSQLFTRGLAGARRLLIGLAVVAFAVWAVGGPPFFPHRSLPFAATSARTAGQSLGQNGGYRLDFWREAIGVFRRHLLTGGGYHSLAVAAAGHVPASWPLSPLAHDGYLQALSDGGLLLGVPFLLATAAIAWYVLAGLASAVRTHDFSTAAFVVPLCLGALLAHSVIDFDWSYAADFEVVAILAGLVAAARWSRTEPAEDRAESQPGRTRAAAIAVVVGVALTGIAAGSSWHGDFRQSLPLGHTSNSGGSA